MQDPNVKRIVCLANSRKLSGRCIAGKELPANNPTGQWIRPVSSRESEEVSEYERQYRDGSDPRVLDILDVPVLRANPKGFQRENWLLDPERYWERVSRVAGNDLERFTDPVAPLWINGDSTYNGRNDRIQVEIADGLDNSLRLVRVNRLELVVSQPGLDFGNYRRRVQGRFQYNGADYWLRVTDPSYERQYLQQTNGNYPIGDAFLTISLGEPFQGYAYKLIAAIIQP